VMECLLSFGAESFVFHFAIQKFNDLKNIELKFCHFVLYGREAWSLTLREEHRLRAFVNRVLGIFELRGTR